MKKGLLISAIASFILIGCGGGDNNNTSNNSTNNSIQKGTGYYVDSAIKGIWYKCGAFEGCTEDAGKFFYQIGSDCTYYLYKDSESKEAKIKIERRDASFFTKNTTTVIAKKDSNNIISLLAALDTDNNLTNGFNIDHNAVEKAFKENKINKLQDIASNFGSITTSYKEHLNTQNKSHYTPITDEKIAADKLKEHRIGEVTKYLSGKTFYLIADNVNYVNVEDKKVSFEEIKFSKNLKTVEVNNESYPLSIGEVYFFINGIGEYTIVDKDNNSILIFNNPNVYKLFFKKSDAKKKVKELNENFNITKDKIKKLIGKKAYYGDNHEVVYEFKKDSIIIKSKSYAYHKIDKNSFILDNGDKVEITYISNNKVAIRSKLDDYYPYFKILSY